MSRANVHDIKNNFGEGLTPAHTQFSGNISLVSPAAGQHLRVYKVVLTGPAALGQAVEVEMRDGSSGIAKHTFGFTAREAPELDLGSRYLQFDDGIHFTRSSLGREDESFVTVFYKEVPNRA